MQVAKKVAKIDFSFFMMSLNQWYHYIRGHNSLYLLSFKISSNIKLVISSNVISYTFNSTLFNYVINLNLRYFLYIFKIDKFLMILVILFTDVHKSANSITDIIKFKIVISLHMAEKRNILHINDIMNTMTDICK